MTTTLQKVKNINELLLDYFIKNKNSLSTQLEADILQQSNGKYRVFHTFFESVEECLSGKFNMQVLAEKDIIAMYPCLMDAIVKVEKGN